MHRHNFWTDDESPWTTGAIVGFVQAGQPGYVVIDLSDALHPVEVHRTTGDEFKTLSCERFNVYAFEHQGIVTVYEFGRLSEPVLIGRYVRPEGELHACALSHERIYLIAGEDESSFATMISYRLDTPDLPQRRWEVDGLALSAIRPWRLEHMVLRNDEEMLERTKLVLMRTGTSIDESSFVTEIHLINAANEDDIRSLRIDRGAFDSHPIYGGGMLFATEQGVTRLHLMDGEVMEIPLEGADRSSGLTRDRGLVWLFLQERVVTVSFNTIPPEVLYFPVLDR